jgi:DNA polymerase-4
MKKIIHIDMDCFFAAVEVKHNSELLGKPIAVGGRAERRGVIATASYEARKFGVRSAMSTAHALRLCPQLILVHPKFSLYKEESLAIKEIFSRYTNIIEPLSLDEAYLDVTDNQDCEGSATLLAKKIRNTILLERGLTASAGIANNKFIAKVCSDLRKPNGQFTVAPHENDSFTYKLPVGKIWGVGKKTESYIKSLGFHTCGDLRKLSLVESQKLFGSMGTHLYKLCRGEDDREVKVSRVRKSFSVEQTFSKDLTNQNEVSEGFKKVFQEFKERFENSKFSNSQIKGLHFKLKSHDFKLRSKDIGAYKKVPGLEVAEHHLIEFWQQNPEDVRLIGFGVKIDHENESQLEFELS